MRGYEAVGVSCSLRPPPVVRSLLLFVLCVSDQAAEERALRKEEQSRPAKRGHGKYLSKTKKMEVTCLKGSSRQPSKTLPADERARVEQHRTARQAEGVEGETLGACGGDGRGGPAEVRARREGEGDVVAPGGPRERAGRDWCKMQVGRWPV